MEFLFKKTLELTEKELYEIKCLFEKVFEKERSLDYHMAQFINNPLGYSFHSIIKDKDKIIGINTFVPSYFLLKDKKMLFVTSIDTMIEKKYRDFFSYYEMITLAIKNLKKEGVKFSYGYPNEISYPIGIKAKLAKDIGKMNLYCLPIHISGVKKCPKFLNFFSETISKLYVVLSGLFASSKEDQYLIKKDEESYNKTRYKRSDGKYGIKKIDDFILYYKVKEHDNIKTAFIIDITKKSPKSFNKSIKFLIREHRKEFDLILYPGYLNFKNTSMFKLPHRFSPKNFYFTGTDISKDLPIEIWNIKNWDTNLSNYDLI